jgi:hypothetical protein
LWDETNANRGVAAQLRQRQASFYGTDVDRGVDVPYGLDNASDRANFFAAYQLLWRDGCEIPGDPQRSSRCRAALYTAALQYRLSGKQQFDRSAAGLREYARPALARSAGEYWPKGLRIPSADLPNRDPLASGGPDGAVADGADVAYASLSARVDVHATFDPLAPRTPSDVWDVAAPVTLDRLVSGLSEFLAESDVQRLSAALASAPAADNAARTTYEAECELTRSQRSASAYRIDFRCVPPREGARGALLQGKLYVDRRKAVHGSLERIVMREEGHGDSELRDIDIAGGKIAPAAAGWHAALPLARGTTRARRSDGNALEHIRLESDRALQAGASSFRGRARIVVVHDFAPVHTIVENMVRDSATGRTDVFANKPFRRVAVMSALLERAGVKALAWCCMEAHGMPPAAMDGHTVAPHDRAQAEAKPLALQPFFRYCATCHQSNERTPPNFLQGSMSAVAANLAHCAQRLHVRLAMWQLPVEHRPKTPMPPYYALHGFQSSPQHWPQSGELAALRSHVERLLQSEHGKVPRPEELLSRGYENLRSCLPEAS